MLHDSWTQIDQHIIAGYDVENFLALTFILEGNLEF